MCLPKPPSWIILSTDEELDQLLRDVMDNPDDETQDPDEDRPSDDGAYGKPDGARARPPG
jgi:hypothetical protein